MTVPDDAALPPADRATCPPADPTTCPPADRATCPPADPTTGPPADPTAAAPAGPAHDPAPGQSAGPPPDPATEPFAEPFATWAAELLAPTAAVIADQLPAIARAATAIAGRIATGGRLVTFGAGHAWFIAAELAWRAGGIPGVVAMNLQDIAGQRDAWHQLADSAPERDPGLARPLAEHHQLTPADALLIASNSARNGLSVELATQFHQAGGLVVAIISTAHRDAVSSRHPSGTYLSDHADIVIDNHGRAGDARIKLAGGQMVGSSSTVVGALIAQLIAIGLADQLRQTDPAFQVIRSANLETATAA